MPKGRNGHCRIKEDTLKKKKKRKVLYNDENNLVQFKWLHLYFLGFQHNKKTSDYVMAVRAITLLLLKSTRIYTGSVPSLYSNCKIRL